MTEIFVADVRFLGDENVFWDKLNMLPLKRQEKLARYKQKEDKMRGLGAGLLLEYGLRRHGFTLLEPVQGMEQKQVEISCGTHGKPYLFGGENIYFNISHSGDYVAAAFSSAEIGIDIERIREMKPEVASRFFHPAEQALLEAEKIDFLDKNTIFTELWTRKESYIKAIGKGMNLPLTSFSVLENQVGDDGRYCLYSFREPEGYCVSICGKVEKEPEMMYVDLMG